MSLGALVLYQLKPKSKLFVPLTDAHQNAITEIRVEQHLDKQTTFAIRFQEDFEDTAAVEEVQQLFSKSQGFAICVPDGPSPGVTGSTPGPLVCLVQGQVEKVEFSVTIGGSGSWFEVRGQDTRTLINRSVGIVSIEGPSDEVIAGLVEPCASEAPVVGPAIKNYVGDEITYRYRGTELEAVYDLARKSNYKFWVKYEVQAIVGAPGVYTIKSTPYVMASPDRGDASGAPPSPGAAAVALVAGDAPARLKILGDEQDCETVASFSSRIDNEGYDSATAFGQSTDDGAEADAEEYESQDAPINPGGETPATAGSEAGTAPGGPDSKLRVVLVGPQPDPDIAPWQAYAAATEASWYVRAEALTSVHMLEKVLAPHEIVEVVGAGCGIAGLYQVTDVTHVVNPASHWMQLELRSNSRSLKPDKSPA